MAPGPPDGPMEVAVVVGTRPEIVKMAPVVLALRDRGVPCALLHTGQHYDREMSEVFLEELGLEAPDAFLEVGSGSQAKQTAEALVRLETAFAERQPGLVLVEGDTNTVLAGALAAVKLGIDVGHVEAGLRSRDLRMPEEHNRRLTDHLSSTLFAPTETAAANLRREGVWGEIQVTGNTAIDACLRYLPLAEARSRVLERVRFDAFSLATVHRAENVDDPTTLRQLVRILREAPLPVVYPVHPRTEKNLRGEGLYGDLADAENVQLLPPQGYLDFLVLMRRAAWILTDSGGIQEEATAPNLRKKAFVLRRSTERPEAVEAGYAEVVGTDANTVLARLRAWVEASREPTGPCPYGDGRAGERIAERVEAVLEGGPGPVARSYRSAP